MEHDEMVAKIARLEVQHMNTKTRIKEIQDNQKEALDLLVELKGDMSMFKGRLGGIFWVVGILWSGALFFKDSIMGWFNGSHT